MKCLLYWAFLQCIFFQARSQLSCKKCTNSIKSECTETEECKSDQTQCLAMQWLTGNTIEKTTGYTMRCATRDECSESKIKELCKNNECAAKCCDSNKCDPFSKRQYVETEERSFYCHECTSESLGSCLKTKRKCEDDQNACLSFLLEGGNLGKVYTKRCARKNECGLSERDKLCAQETDQSQRKNCRSSCCYFDLCNDVARKTVSLVIMTIFLVLSLFIVY